MDHIIKNISATVLSGEIGNDPVEGVDDGVVLESLTIENYRAFASAQKIDICPLTLFFGWNNSGKSALVRFLPLLAESVIHTNPPIFLSGDAGNKAAWSDLVCKATGRNVMGFTLQWRTTLGTFAAQWKVRGSHDGGRQEIESFDLTCSALSRSFTENQFTGLVPDIVAGDKAERDVANLKKWLQQLADQVQWIRGVRKRPDRHTSYSGGTSSKLRADGGDAVDHLIAAQLRSVGDPLLTTVRDFFAALGGHLSLDNPFDNIWRIQLYPVGIRKILVNLCDTGEGYTQILPILVAMARARSGGPKILCLEQPELHLHTQAQVELAKLLVASVMTEQKPSILVETHSEVLLISVQVAIAEGQISPDLVRVYWVESLGNGTSMATPVDFNVYGQPKNTKLTGAFKEVVGLGRQFIQAKMKRNCL